MNESDVEVKDVENGRSWTAEYANAAGHNLGLVDFGADISSPVVRAGEVPTAIGH